MGRGEKGTKEVALTLLNNEDTDPLQKAHNFDQIDKKKGDPDSVTHQNIPTGVPECDILLKGSTRFWYLESALFLFGIAGVIISAIMLALHYINSSNYF